MRIQLQGEFMLFQGLALCLRPLSQGLVELHFNLQGESVNKFNTLTTQELGQALDTLEATAGVRGLLVTSGKGVFIVGADVTEFGPVFALGEAGVRAHLHINLDLFNRLEDLPFPTLVAINGYALGGGLEFCLACDYRLISQTAKIGLPETKLGIIPGWGGTVRLPRLAGVDVAADWIASGAEQPAAAALAAGVVDGICSPEDLLPQAEATLLALANGHLPYLPRRAKKTGPLPLNRTEATLAFESAKAFVAAQAGRHYPAPLAALQAMQKAASHSREQALKLEQDAFVAMAATPQARALLGVFLSDQALSKKAKFLEKQAQFNLRQAAVLGAGIMGGGIAYQSASKGVPIIMKDIAQAGLNLGLKEAAKLLTARVEKGRLSPADMAATLARITPSLHYQGFEQVDIVVEAVVENPGVKARVLAEAETHLGENSLLCSNTSTISITQLAHTLSRPENFCGMHFFNPVHAMPLVEIIRGEKTSDLTVARTLAYANALGKKAIVVNDCPGFLVNRVLFPYFLGFALLVRDGVDFQHIDRVMEQWGWPMGPAYLLDVIGLDTAVHAQSVMAQGFPNRMQQGFTSALDTLFQAGHLGQKTQQGFYRYSPDKKGKPQKSFSTDIFTQIGQPHLCLSDDAILYRMLLPMVTELVRCLDEGIVASAAEADLALLYGLGFPPFRGGIFRWIDEVGASVLAQQAQALAALGPLYHLPDSLAAKVSQPAPYYA